MRVSEGVTGRGEARRRQSTAIASVLALLGPDRPGKAAKRGGQWSAGRRRNALVGRQQPQSRSTRRQADSPAGTFSVAPPATGDLQRACSGYWIGTKASDVSWIGTQRPGPNGQPSVLFSCLAAPRWSPLTAWWLTLDITDRRVQQQLLEYVSRPLPTVSQPGRLIHHRGGRHGIACWKRAGQTTAGTRSCADGRSGSARARLFVRRQQLLSR